MSPPELLLLTREDARPVAAVPPPQTTTTATRRRRRLTEGGAVFGLAAGLYGALGVWLVLAHNIVFVDTLARTANAYYVIASRDPHLAAVGFVWNPLPSLAMIPLLELRAVEPALLQYGLAGNLVSALVMAGALYQVNRLFFDEGLGRLARLTLTILLALQPMITLYGANGMSEAWFLFALAWSTRRLCRWMRTQQLPDLASCAAGLGVAYLCRHEAMAAAAAVTVLVGWQSWSRAGGLPHRRMRACTDALLVSLPVLTAFVGWALLSWIVVGHPFEVIQSTYSNSALVELNSANLAEATGATAVARVSYFSEQVLWLAPAVALLAPVALLTAIHRTQRHLLAPLAVFGSVLAFQAVVFSHGSTFGWLRYAITAIPLTAILAGMLLAAASRNGIRLLVGLAAVTASVAGCVTSWHPMLDIRLGQEEAVVLQPLLVPERAAPMARATQTRYENEREIAAWLDRQALPEGAVLVDTQNGFPIVVSSEHPKQFVITSDLDFESAVADPAINGVRYLLTQPGPLDALNISRPGIYESGAPFLRRIQDFPPQGVGVPWRVYEVVETF